MHNISLDNLIGGWKENSFICLFAMKSTLPLYNKKVLILGNWSYKNLWDELILLGTIRLLQEQGNEVVVSAYDPSWLQSFFSHFSEIKTLTFLHEFPKGFRSAFRYFFSSRIKELMTYRNVDAVIIGGGEILTEESKNAYRYWNLGLLPLFWKLKTTAIYLMGGIQVPQKKGNLIFFRWLLKRTKGIFARDQESVQALKTFWYSDVEFFMDTSFFAYPWQRIKKQKSDSKVILINLNKNGEQFFDQLVSECRTFITTWFTLKYVPVSKGNSLVYNDLAYKEKLEQQLWLSLPIVDWESDFSAFVQEIADAELIITARLHLFLIASFIATKVKVYPYQKKILKMQGIINNEQLTVKN